MTATNLDQLMAEQVEQFRKSNDEFAETQKRMSREQAVARAKILGVEVPEEDQKEDLSPEIQQIVSNLQQHPILIGPTLELHKQISARVADAVQEILKDFQPAGGESGV